MTADVQFVKMAKEKTLSCVAFLKPSNLFCRFVIRRCIYKIKW